MIRVGFLTAGGRCLGFRASGHAGYGDYGQDIVCASVTSAIQLTANGITEAAGVEADVRAEENLVSLTFPDGCKDETAQKMLAALRLHLTILSHDYPKTIEITDLEV